MFDLPVWIMVVNDDAHLTYQLLLILVLSCAVTQTCITSNNKTQRKLKNFTLIHIQEFVFID